MTSWRLTRGGSKQTNDVRVPVPVARPPARRGARFVALEVEVGGAQLLQQVLRVESASFPVADACLQRESLVKRY